MKESRRPKDKSLDVDFEFGRICGAWEAPVAFGCDRQQVRALIDSRHEAAPVRDVDLPYRLIRHYSRRRKGLAVMMLTVFFFFIFSTLNPFNNYSYAISSNRIDKQYVYEKTVNKYIENTLG